MTSEISAIYTAIENMTVTVNNATPIVYGLTGIPNSLANANLPCRILLDLANAGEGQTMDFRTVGSGINGGGKQYVDWQFNDLMLYLPLALGTGNKQVTSVLVAYLGAYIDAARANRELVNTANSSASITGLKVTPGVYEYPSGSGSQYWGCMTAITVREIIG